MDRSGWIVLVREVGRVVPSSMLVPKMDVAVGIISSSLEFIFR